MTGFISPTVPADLGNQVVMRAWFQALRKSMDGVLVSVKDFGAIGNGNVDDTDAFSKALAYADQNYNCIYVPAGNYKLTSGFTLTSAISIFGDGPSLSVLEPHFDASDTFLFKMTAGGSLNIFDLGFDGNDVSNPTPTNMVYMINVTPTSGTLENVDIHNVKFSNLTMFNGVYGTAADADLRVTHCMIFDSTNHISVTDCVADTISGSFVYMTDCTNVTIKDNSLEDVNWYPIHLEEGNKNVTIENNKFNLIATGGILFGGAIDILESVSNTLVSEIDPFTNDHLSIQVINNEINGYVSWDGVIHISSAISVKVAENIIKKVQVGTRGVGVITDFACVRVRTRGASDTLEYGPCLNISICDNFFEGAQTATGEIKYGVYISNDSQSVGTILERRQIERIQICRNQMGYHLWNTNTYGRAAAAFDRGIVVNGMAGGVETIVVEDNIIYTSMGTSGSPKGSGAISFFGASADGGCDKIQIGGNHIINYSATTKYGIDIGAYSTNVINTKPNYIEGCDYGVATSATGNSGLYYLDDQVIISAATANYLFNTQLTKAYHRTDGGTTANRPGSTSNRTTYTTYYDTSLDCPLWFDGTNWSDAYGTTAGGYTDGQLLIGNTSTGTLDPATLTAGTNVTITNAGNSITINAPTPAGIVNTTGTPANNQIAIFTDEDTIEGDSDLTWDNTTFTINGAVSVTTANGINYTPGSDIDTDLITVDVTGSPTLSWDESSDGFRSNKSWVIGSDGNGDITHTVGGTAVTSTLEIHSEGAGDIGGVAIHRHTDNNNFGGHLLFLRSDGTHASPALVDDNDTIGRLVGAGYDGTDNELVAEIRFKIDGTPSNDNMPGEITFYTNGGSQTLTERARIRADGTLEADYNINLAASTVLEFAGTAILSDSAGTMTLSNVDALDSTTNETICDAVGAMVTGNTETNITVTYQDADNTIDFAVADATTSTKGAASFDTDDFTVTSGAVSLKDVKFRAYLSANQSVNSGSIDKVLLNTETFDTNSNFDNATNYRFTPTVAGKYLITCTGSFNSLNDGTAAAVGIYKNGAIYKWGQLVCGAAASNLYITVSDIISMNGSTDYIEMYVVHNAGSAKNVLGGNEFCSLSGAFVGP